MLLPSTCISWTRISKTASCATAELREGRGGERAEFARDETAGGLADGVAIELEEVRAPLNGTCWLPKGLAWRLRRDGRASGVRGARSSASVSSAAPDGEASD